MSILTQTAWPGRISSDFGSIFVSEVGMNYRLQFAHCSWRQFAPSQVNANAHSKRLITFRYENNWKYKPLFKNLIQANWSNWIRDTDMADTLNSKLKNPRKQINIWKRNCKPVSVYLEFCISSL